MFFREVKNISAVNPKTMTNPFIYISVHFTDCEGNEVHMTAVAPTIDLAIEKLGAISRNKSFMEAVERDNKEPLPF